MMEKLSHRILKLCDKFEIIISLLVGIGIGATLISYLIPGLLELFHTYTGTAQFLIYLEDIFNLVVGIEFMKLLCHISSDNVIEVLVILIARHMIVEAHSAMDIFLSTLSIVLLYLLRSLIHWMKHVTESRFKKIPTEIDTRHPRDDMTYPREDMKENSETTSNMEKA